VCAVVGTAQFHVGFVRLKAKPWLALTDPEATHGGIDAVAAKRPYRQVRRFGVIATRLSPSALSHDTPINIACPPGLISCNAQEPMSLTRVSR
jgi:hypothetical protein